MRKLTEKQKGFIKDVIRTKNPAEAVRRNYKLGNLGGSKTPEHLQNTASSIAYENLRKPHIIKILEDKGLKVEDLVDELKECMKISKEQGYLNTYHDTIKTGFKLHGEMGDKKEITNIAVIGYINSSELKKLPKEAINGDYKEIKQE
jgi:hypothetical protein